MDEITTSSPAFAKPNVGRSASLGVAQNIFDTIFVSTAMWATENQQPIIQTPTQMNR